MTQTFRLPRSYEAMWVVFSTAKTAIFMERFESLYCGWTALNLSDISLSAISEVFSEEKEQTFTNSCETTIVQDERLLVSRKIRNLDP